MIKTDDVLYLVCWWSEDSSKWGYNYEIYTSEEFYKKRESELISLKGVKFSMDCIYANRHYDYIEK